MCASQHAHVILYETYLQVKLVLYKLLPYTVENMVQVYNQSPDQGSMQVEQQTARAHSSLSLPPELGHTFAGAPDQSCYASSGFSLANPQQLTIIHLYMGNAPRVNLEQSNVCANTKAATLGRKHYGYKFLYFRFVSMFLIYSVKNLGYSSMRGLKRLPFGIFHALFAEVSDRRQLVLVEPIGGPRLPNLVSNYHNSYS